MSLRLRLLNSYLRRIEKPWLRRVSDPLRMRRGFERSSRVFRDPKGALYLPDRLNGVPVLWAQVGARRTGAILYLHGGAYLVGGPATHRAMCARLSQLTGLRCCLPQYRLAPEHPFPAALEDALAAWDGLLARGYPARHIVLGGDSAGGGLMLALLARLLQRGQRPAAAFAMSPWTDMTLSGNSLRENAGRDPLLPVQRIEEARGFYLGQCDPADPGVSPLLARFPDAPPVLLQASRSEVLRDDTTRMAQVLRDQGAPVELDLWRGTPHVWPIFQGWLPEADVALGRIAAFVRAKLWPAGAGQATASRASVMR